MGEPKKKPLEVIIEQMKTKKQPKETKDALRKLMDRAREKVTTKGEKPR